MDHAARESVLASEVVDIAPHARGVLRQAPNVAVQFLDPLGQLIEAGVEIDLLRFAAWAGEEVEVVFEALLG